MTHGYFRLSGYWRFFQIDPAASNNIFTHGTEFSTVLDLYLLDTELRNLLLEGLAEVEIALRSSIVANMCVPGQFGTEYLDPQIYKSWVNTSTSALFRDELLTTIESDLVRSKERHVVHHRRAGMNQVPLWVATEALSFGTLSRMFGLWADAQGSSRVAKRFGYDKGLESSFQTNLRAISVFRNVCAHHGRNWNRVVTSDKPRLFAGAFPEEHGSVTRYAETTWGAIRVLCHFVENIRKDDSFTCAVDVLVNQDPVFKKGLTQPDRAR